MSLVFIPLMSLLYFINPLGLFNLSLLNLLFFFQPLCFGLGVFFFSCVSCIFWLWSWICQPIIDKKVLRWVWGDLYSLRLIFCLLLGVWLRLELSFRIICFLSFFNLIDPFSLFNLRSFYLLFLLNSLGFHLRVFLLSCISYIFWLRSRICLLKLFGLLTRARYTIWLDFHL